MLAEIEVRLEAAIEAGVDRAALQKLLPPGGARNAVDCALWGLRGASPGRRGVGVGRSGVAQAAADDVRWAPMIRRHGCRERSSAQARAPLKLTGELPVTIERVKAVRAARPRCVDGRRRQPGLHHRQARLLLGVLIAANVSLLEQPLKLRGREADLDGFKSPIPIAADESVLSLNDVPGLAGRFNVVNIKLDRRGGLTEGLPWRTKHGAWE